MSSRMNDDDVLVDVGLQLWAPSGRATTEPREAQGEVRARWVRNATERLLITTVKQLLGIFEQTYKRTDPTRTERDSNEYPEFSMKTSPVLCLILE